MAEKDISNSDAQHILDDVSTNPSAEIPIVYEKGDSNTIEKSNSPGTVVVEKATTSDSTKKSSAKNRRKGKRRSVNRNDPDSDFAETEQLKNRLLKRTEKDTGVKGTKRGKLENERGPIIRRESKDPTCVHEIVNPSTYDKLFNRLEETNSNKPVKQEGTCLENAPWICCFCQREPCVDDLGDLFGPYYVKLAAPEFWPPFVDRPNEEKSARRSSISDSKSHLPRNDSSNVIVDLWLHGDCVYWSPGVLLRGRGMTGLEENLPTYWKLECSYCRKLGASMVCNVKSCGKTFHYPCAIASGASLKESTFTMYCETHKKIMEKSEKRK